MVDPRLADFVGKYTPETLVPNQPRFCSDKLPLEVKVEDKILALTWPKIQLVSGGFQLDSDTTTVVDDTAESSMKYVGNTVYNDNPSTDHPEDSTVVLTEKVKVFMRSIHWEDHGAAYHDMSDRWEGGPYEYSERLTLYPKRVPVQLVYSFYRTAPGAPEPLVDPGTDNHTTVLNCVYRKL